MKFTRILWIIIGIIGIGWIYYLYISPRIFHSKVVCVPNFVGLTEEELKQQMKKEKLNYKIYYIDGESFCVDYTVPKEGSKVYTTYPIEVYIEKPLPKYYPNFVGLIYENNIDWIQQYCEKQGIEYSVEYVVQNEANSGQIIAQSKKTEEQVVKGEKLVLTVAVNDQYFTMPNLSGLPITDVIRLLDSYDLNYNIIYYNAPIEKDIVLSQSILEGTILKKGNRYAFDVYVSKGMPMEVTGIKIEEFLYALNELDIEYDIIYVNSISNQSCIVGLEKGKEWKIYMTK